TGACVGSNSVACNPQDQCHAAGTCNPSTGTCSNPVLADGSACNDGNNCTGPDVCSGGTCAGTPLGSCGLSPPPLDRTIAMNLFAATSFLYSGANPIQTGGAAGASDVIRASVIGGLFMDR